MPFLLSKWNSDLPDHRPVVLRYPITLERDRKTSGIILALSYGYESQPMPFWYFVSIPDLPPETSHQSNLVEIGKYLTVEGKQSHSQSPGTSRTVCISLPA
jgi:hypothetical protein